MSNLTSCFFCGNPCHPATSHMYSATAMSCKSCTTTFWKWMENHTNKRPSKRFKGPRTSESFYEAATNVFSTRPMFRSP